MKNAVITGLIIGILSGLWLLITHWTGYTTSDPHQVAPFEYLSMLIPFLGLYFGVRAYRQTAKDGVISFLEALVQCFKTLLVGGAIAIFAAIVYINYVYAGTNFADFSGRIFGAMLIGILSSLAVSLILMNKSKAI